MISQMRSCVSGLGVSTDSSANAMIELNEPMIIGINLSPPASLRTTAYVFACES